MAPTTTLVVLSAVLSCFLGVMVILRNPSKRTHRKFAVLSLNLTLWSLGVLAIIHCDSVGATQFWVRLTFIVASFLPATYYHFIIYFPNQQFKGVRSILALLYAAAVFQAIGAFTPWYIKDIAIIPDLPPQVTYGPVFQLYSVWVGLAMLFSFTNLGSKLRQAVGVERRQIEHVLLGIFLCTTLSTMTNVLAPVLHITSLECYGPVFTVLLMGLLAYAMVRYHLLDIWVLVSRTTIYAITTAFVIAMFFGTISLVHLLFTSAGHANELLTTILPALVIAVVLQPLKERLQLFVEQTILKRHYDVNRLCARITRHAAQFMRLDQLLDTVTRDIQATVGIHSVRVWLVDEKDPTTLVCECSSNPGELHTRTRDYAKLVEYLQEHTEPIVLKRLLHERVTTERAELARHLAEMDSHLCLPLHAGARIAGILSLGEKTSNDIYSVDDLAVFTTVAGPLGTAIENSRLYVRLEEVNLHLARILSSMRGGVVAVDTKGKVTTFNNSATELFGAVEIGQGLSQLKPELAQVLEQTLKDGKGIGDFEVEIAGPSGEKVPLVLSSSCLQIPGNGNCGAMVMIHDLTQVRRLERNVQRADRLSSIGILAAGMAHEIKNPLVSIKTFTQLLLARFDEEDFRKTYSDVVPHEVERIDTIVTRLLDFARPKPVRFAPQDPQIIIEQVVALVENQTKKAGITVELDFSEKGVMVRGDDQQLHQLFLNLFLNAIDAMEEKRDGVLTVTVVRTRTYLRRSAKFPFMERDCVRVTVTDNGCGIPPANIEQLFTPFFTTKDQGCGLGLSVVHGIVTEHGGEIDVESQPDRGTSFTVTLPLLDNAATLESMDKAS